MCIYSHKQYACGHLSGSTDLHLQTACSLHEYNLCNLPEVSSRPVRDPAQCKLCQRATTVNHTLLRGQTGATNLRQHATIRGAAHAQIEADNLRADELTRHNAYVNMLGDLLRSPGLSEWKRADLEDQYNVALARLQGLERGRGA